MTASAPPLLAAVTPGVFLLAGILVTVAAAAIDAAAHVRRARGLRGLAAQWRMNYQPADKFRVTPKVLPHLRIPGAANVRVMDLIYGSDRDRYRYVFSVEFTLGVVGPKRRVVRVASLSEPRERGATGNVSLVLAPAEGKLLDQYRYFAPSAVQAAAPTLNG